MKCKFILPICAFYINFSTFGFMRSGGVLYMSFVREFNCTYAQAGWSISIIGSFASFTIFLAGFLTHYFEKRSIIIAGIFLSSFSIGLNAFFLNIQFIIFLSAIQGIGIGLFVGLLPIVISENSDHGRSIACGLSYSGATMAAFIFPPLIQTIIEHFNLKAALIMLSFVSFSSLFAAWPLKTKSPNNVKKINTNELNSLFQQLLTDLKVLKLFPFWIVTVIYVIFIYVFLMFIIILPELAVSRNINKQSAALLLSIYSISDFFGRLIPGYSHFKNIVHNQTLYLYSKVFMSILFILVKFYAISFSTFAILCAALGFVTGIQMTLPVVVMVELIGLKQTTIGFGLSNILSGLIALSRPLLIDFIITNTNGYDWLLIINGALCLFATFPWYLYTVCSSASFKEKERASLEESV